MSFQTFLLWNTKEDILLNVSVLIQLKSDMDKNSFFYKISVEFHRIFWVNYSML